MNPDRRGQWLVLIALLACPLANAQDADELAKQLSNPVASLISVPLQFNYDDGIGPTDDGSKTYLNVQPVIPVSISEDWNMISRTIIPIVYQEDAFPGAGSQFGTGDVLQSLFFSPKKPTASGWIWGGGPIFYLPTASDDLLGADKWGAGPTAVALKQTAGGWTYGALLITCGHSLETTIAPTSAARSCSRSCRRDWGRGGRWSSTWNRPTTGKASNGRCRSISVQQGWQDRQPAGQLPGRSALLHRGPG